MAFSVAFFNWARTLLGVLVGSAASRTIHRYVLLCCVVLCCIAFCQFVLCCTVSYCIALCRILLHSVVLCYIILYSLVWVHGRDGGREVYHVQR